MPKGIRHGGRGKGTPNKATGKAREIIAQIADEMSLDFKQWLSDTAAGLPEHGVKPDPKGAASLYLAAIEYHIPKLARTESQALDKNGNPADQPAIKVEFVTKAHTDT